MSIEAQVDKAINRAKIEELEQMKEKINNLKGIKKRAGRNVYIAYPNVVYKEDVIKIIDKYLDELKGDNENDK